MGDRAVPCHAMPCHALNRRIEPPADFQPTSPYGWCNPSGVVAKQGGAEAGSGSDVPHQRIAAGLAVDAYGGVCTQYGWWL